MIGNVGHVRSRCTHWLCVLLAVFMVFTILPRAYAAESTTGWEAWASHAAADPVIATRADVYEVFGWPVEYLWDGMNGSTPASVEDVLYSLSRTWGVLETDTGYTYPLGDGAWMSAAEWAELSRDLSAPVPRGILSEIGRRTKTHLSALDELSGIKSADAYITAVAAFYPEFLPLAGNNRNAVSYWLRHTDGLDVRDGYFGGILHEIAHETSARLSGAFLYRRASGTVWSVFWNPNVREIHPYDVRRHESVEIKMKQVPKTLDLIDADTVPEFVRTMPGYSSYFEKTSASHTFGAYGMLEEFCAETVELRYKVLSAAMGRGRRSFWTNDLRGVCFWDGFLGCYLRALQEKEPELYAELMSDEAFAGVLSDTCTYVAEQISMIRIRNDPVGDRTLSELQDWAKNQGVSALLAQTDVSSDAGTAVLPAA